MTDTPQNGPNSADEVRASAAILGTSTLTPQFTMEPGTREKPMREPDRPSVICLNCWRAWRALPLAVRDPLLICNHLRAAARLTSGGSWKTLGAITPAEARELRGLPPLARGAT